MELSPEEIQRRSKLATELGQRHDPLTGRRVFGGHQPGSGRPKKRRATEIMNDEIEKNAKDYWQRLHNIALNDPKSALAIQAIGQLVAIANKESDIQAREDREMEKTSTEDLIEIVSTRLARLSESGKLPFDFEADESDAEEITEPIAEIEQRIIDDDEPEGSSGNGSTGSGFGTSAFARRPAD